MGSVYILKDKMTLKDGSCSYEIDLFDSKKLQMVPNSNTYSIYSSNILWVWFDFIQPPFVATTYSSLHLLFPSDAATTSPTFLYELNYATLHNTTLLGSFQCGSYCSTCAYISNGRTSYTFHSTGETRPITYHITCNSKNVIYMILRKRCHKQY